MTEETITEEAPDDTEQEIEGLGDAGKAAIDRERERAKDFERKFKAAEKARKDLETKHASAQDIAIAKAKEEGKAEILSTANQKVLRAEVKVAAAGKLKNPALAWALLEDVRDSLMDDEGEVDEAKLKRAIDRIVKENPELSAERVLVRTGGDFSNSGASKHADMNANIRRAAGRV